MCILCLLLLKQSPGCYLSLDKQLRFVFSLFLIMYIVFLMDKTGEVLTRIVPELVFLAKLT